MASGDLRVLGDPGFFVWKGRVYRCEGQRHDEGGAAHSALTPDGLLMWWEYGGGRTAKVLRPATKSEA